MTNNSNKKIINHVNDAVTEMMQGLLRQYPHTLTCCEAPYSNVLVGVHSLKKNTTTEKTTTTASTSNRHVALISGGGCGHEPSHAGWIGEGMLTSVVCGGIFASPSIASIRAAIRVVAAENILLIVKNYTGDCLNFGMAVEMELSSTASNDTKKNIQMVVVADDVALPRTKGITGARGLAGTVLVHKIAGAAAQTGQSLAQVAALARLACARMGTLGIALETVAVPGAPKAALNRLPEDAFEVGLGIHGEAGLCQSPAMTANEMVSTMIDSIQSYGRLVDNNTTTTTTTTTIPMFQAGDELCVLVNNLGGTSEFEMSILAQACVTQLESQPYHANVRLLYVGSYMTSFNMHGASLTILNLTPELTELLEAPTSAPAWKPFQYTANVPSPIAVPTEAKDAWANDDAALPLLQIANFSTMALIMIVGAAHRIIDHEPLLTQYDTIVGDGDCGFTMKRGAVALLECTTLNTSHPVRLYTQIADLLSSSMGGTSGVLLELGFRKMAACLMHVERITAVELFRAFQQGVQAIGFYGRATLGARTMLDALIPASQVTNEPLLQSMAHAARQGADRTALMGTASAGRSNYLSKESLQGTPDPGAIAMALILEAMAVCALSSFQ